MILNAEKISFIDLLKRDAFMKSPLCPVFVIAADAEVTGF
jgi:hypothetical protein